MAEKRHRGQLSKNCSIVNPLPVNRCIAGGQKHATLVRVSLYSAGKAQMGNGKLNNSELCSRQCDVTRTPYLPGVDHTMRSSRISWRCRVLWLDGTGCNEAYHGTRILVHLGSASLIFSQGIEPLLFFGGATLGCMGMYLCISISYFAHRLSHI